MTPKGTRTSDMGRTTVAVATAGLVVVALLAAGTAVGALLWPQRVAQESGTAAGAQFVDVSKQVFDDAHDAVVRMTFADPVSLTVGDGGRVTASSCAPGATLASGSGLLTVDDRPVVALATSQPLWRDLAVGSTGADVTALQTELARLGYAVTVDGRFGSATKNAVNRVLSGVGVVKPAGVLAAASVLWLPGPQVTVATCAVSVGDVLGGGEVATVGGGLVALTPAQEVAGSVAGARVLRYRDASAAVGEDGTVTDATFLAAVAAGPEVAYALSQGTGQLTLSSALAEPQDVVVVPPAAIYGVEADRGCVLTEAGPAAVRVVASALGRTMVVPDDGSVPARVDARPGADAGACR